MLHWLTLGILGALLHLTRIGRPRSLSRLRSQFRSTFDLSSTLMHHSLNVNSEGCQPVMGLTEVTLTHIQHTLAGIVTKTHDDTSPPVQILRGSTNKKRSLRRAQQRALATGYTWYRGKLVTPSSIGCQTCTKVPAVHASPKSLRTLPQNTWKQIEPRQLRNRCNVMTWNTSGLTNAVLHELLSWAEPQNLQVIILTETRWQGTRTWIQQGWHCVSTAGDPYRTSGIVACVRASFCHSDRLGWNVLSAGRMLHLRLFLQQRSIDIICAYQHAFHADHVTRAARTQWFTLLDTTLSQLPRRNQLIVAGDFNTSLTADGCTVGLSHFRTQAGKHVQGSMHPDKHILQDILKQHGIVALNTWRTDSASTFYSSQNMGSRIDFICIRYRQADKLAKQSTSVPDWPPLPLTTQGHYPVIGNIPLRWISSQGCTLSNIGYQARERCRQARAIEPYVWESFQQASNQFLLDTTWPQNGNFDHIHTGLNRIFTNFFAPAQTIQACTDDTPIRHKWDIRRALRAIHGRQIRHCFQAWKLACMYQAWHRTHAEAVKKRKDDRLQHLLESAEAAARQHDMCRLYNLINRLTPKTRPDKIQLRSPEGQLLSPTESFHTLCRFVTETWDGHPLILPAAPAPGIPFSESELARALSRTKGMKSMAPHKSPGFSLKCTATCMATQLMPLLHKWWGQSPPLIPQEWRDGWLFLLPKPSKPPDRPSNLRPLALQEGLGKAVLSLICTQARSRL